MNVAHRYNLAVYVPVVLSSYGLAGATVDALTGARTDQRFWTAPLLWAAVGWWVPLVLLPAALALLALASRLPAGWGAARRRVVLLVAAPPLFAAAMGAAALAVSGDTTVLTSAYVAVVVVPALAYAAVVRTPLRPVV